jgi:hypothetical protein
MPLPKGKKATSTTPTSVMGSQGKSAPLKLDHFHNKPTTKKPFPQ